MKGYSELKRIIPGAYNLSDFMTGAKSASIDEIMILLQVNHTGSGCRSGTNNLLVLRDPKKRIRDYQAAKISVKGGGYTAKEYSSIASEAEKLTRELKGFKVSYGEALTEVLRMCEGCRGAPT